MNDETPEQPNTEPDDAARKIEAILARLVRTRKRAENSVMLFFVAEFLNWLFFILLDGRPERYNAILGHLIIMIIFVPTMVFSWSKYGELAEPLRNLNDVNLIGALLDSMTFQQKSLSLELIPALTRLLNQLQSSQGYLLNASQRRTLYKLLRSDNKWLNHHSDRNLTCAIFNALEQVGDKDAIPHIERIARSSKSSQTREKAEECLVFLHQRAEQQSVSGTLLRPSEAENAAPDTLLRATTARPEEASELLLRVAVSHEHDA